MRKRSSCLGIVLIGAVALNLAPAAARAQYEFHYFKQAVELVVDVERVAVVEADNVASGSVRTALAKHGFEPASVIASPVPRLSFAAVPSSSRTVKGVEELTRAVAVDGDVPFITPVFLDENNLPRIMLRHIHVRFAKDVSAEQAEAILSQVGAGAIEEREWARMDGVYRVLSASRNGFEVLRIANELAKRSDVLFAEPDMILTGWTTVVIPTDPGFGLSWGLHNTGQSGGTPDMDMDAPEAWDYSTGDESIIVAILDTGCQQDHPDINQIPGADFTGQGTGGAPGNVCDGHGTTTSGTISSIMNNGIGTAGICPNCRTVSTRVFISNVPCDGFGSIPGGAVVNALTYAENIGARVTSTSLGFGSNSTISNKFASSRDNGIIHFSSSGNGGVGSIGYPANLSSVNAVGALTRNGNRASFSQFGTGLAFSAPGVSIYTTDETGSDGFSGGDYTIQNGTSYASPYAAGVAALALSIDPSLTPTALETLMDNTCMDLGTAGYDTEFGWGFLNAFALAEAVAPLVAPCAVDKLVAFDAEAGDWFGYQCDVSGDVAVGGSYNDSCTAGSGCGAAYVRRWNGTDWSDETKVVPSSREAGDWFGWSVAISGDVLVAGAPNRDHGGAVGSAGAAIVFRWDGGAWVEEDELRAADADTSDQFGTSVAIDGGVIAVGAPGDDDDGSGSGAMYLFRYDGDSETWIEEDKVTASDAAASDALGTAVAVDGDLAVAGARGTSCAFGSSCGAAYVYRYNGVDSWPEEEKLVASDGRALDNFGISVAVSGNVVISGSYLDQCVGTGSDCGSAYAYRYDEGGGTWSQEQKLLPISEGAGDLMGHSVALDGDTAVIGAENRGCVAGTRCGAAYVFRYDGAGAWNQESRLEAFDQDTDDRFGVSVAVDGRWAAVGANRDDDGGNDSGSVYVLGVSGDCNENRLDDVCDILLLTSPDLDSDGVPDECGCIPSTEAVAHASGPSNRYLSIDVGDAGRQQAVRVIFADLPAPFDAFNGTTMWFGEPHDVSEVGGVNDTTPPTFSASLLQCTPHFTDWTTAGSVHAYHAAIVPDGVYDIQVIDSVCNTAIESQYSTALRLTQSKNGDLVGSFNGTTWEPADDSVDVATDVIAVLDKFRSTPAAPIKARADLEPASPDQIINITDAIQAIDGFRGLPYPFAPGAAPCP